jgi:hypothetical protein
MDAKIVEIEFFSTLLGTDKLDILAPFFVPSDYEIDRKTKRPYDSTAFSPETAVKRCYQ